jgi:hypothetical protein
MDEADPLQDEDEPPSPPPSAFGLPARPLGCGLLGGALFALAFAPVVLLYVAPNTCWIPGGGVDCPWPPEGTRLGLALTAWAAAAFGLATAWLVARRLTLWREGRRVRPALWVAFVALFAIGWGPGSVLLSLLLMLIAAVRG